MSTITGFQMERYQKARVHHVCSGGHLILPGDTYIVGVILPGEGRYPIGGGDYESESWEFGWDKMCLPCEASYYHGENIPPRDGFAGPRTWRRAIERAYRNGHHLDYDPPQMSAVTRLSCTDSRCSRAIIHSDGVIYGSAADHECKGGAS